MTQNNNWCTYQVNVIKQHLNSIKYTTIMTRDILWYVFHMNVKQQDLNNTFTKYIWLLITQDTLFQLMGSLLIQVQVRLLNIQSWDWTRIISESVFITNDRGAYKFKNNKNLVEDILQFITISFVRQNKKLNKINIY